MGEGDRPKAAIGHVTLRVQDVKGSCAFYVQLGLRLVVENWAGAKASRSPQTVLPKIGQTRCKSRLFVRCKYLKQNGFN